MGAVRRLGLVGAWLLVVVVVTTVTWQIVSVADDQVSERPTSLNVAAPVISSLTTSTTTHTTQATVTPTTVDSGKTTTTIEQNTTTTTAAAGAGWQTQSVQTAGGTVVVRYRPGEVTYQAATPAKGFYVEVEEFGPPEVQVKFESEGSEIEVRAVWQNNQLDVDTAESAHD
jgi:hypothetical protein